MQSVILGATLQFTATVTNSTNTGVNWNVNGIPGGNAAVGTISTTGLFTAPQNLPANVQVTITAVSQASPGSSGSTTVTITSDITINVTATSLSIELGAQQQFNATVNSAGNPNRNVNWSITGAGCAGGACGTISSVGLYIAPSVLPSPANFSVVATSQADPSKTGSANATAIASFTIAVNGLTSVDNANSTTFIATITPVPGSNPSPSVNWSVAPGPNGTCTGSGTGTNQCGTINMAGLFSAATVAPAPPNNVVRITATSVADPSKSAFIDVTINTVVLVAFSQSSSTAELDTAQQFAVNVGGTTNQNVTWDINGVVGGNLTLGTITNPGSGPATYNAPGTIPSPATITITATSQFDNTKSASVQVTLFSTISIALTANSTVRAVNRRLTIFGGITRVGGLAPSNKAVTWTVNTVAGGNATVGQTCLVTTDRADTNCTANTVSNADIAGGVDFLAPGAVPVGNPVIIEAVSQADPSKKGTFQITVLPGVTVSVSPASSTLPVNQRQQLLATVQGSDITNVTWEVEGVTNGNITVGQICIVGSNPCTPPGPSSQPVEYLAPNAAPANPPVDIRAISADDPLQSGTAAVTIAVGAFITSLQPASITAGPAGSFTLRVRGNNFDTGANAAQIRLDNVALTTTCTTSTECTATIAPADVAASGNKTVQINNPSGTACNPACPGLSNSVNLVVVAAAATEAVISLDPNNPAAAGQDIIVVDPTSLGSPQGVSAQINMDLLGLIVAGSCSLRGTMLAIPRPQAGSQDVDICVSTNGPTSLQGAGNVFTISGPTPPDITITLAQPFGQTGLTMLLRLNIPSTAQVGPRTIFVETANKEKSALTGGVEIK
jgi:hypothetical protein